MVKAFGIHCAMENKLETCFMRDYPSQHGLYNVKLIIAVKIYGVYSQEFRVSLTKFM